MPHAVPPCSFARVIILAAAARVIINTAACCRKLRKVIKDFCPQARPFFFILETYARRPYIAVVKVNIMTIDTDDDEFPSFYLLPPPLKDELQ